MSYINDPGNEVPENKIVFYRQHETYDHDISEVIEPLVGKTKRDWFAEHFYYCLPLTIANQYGFVVKSAENIDLYWNDDTSKVYLETDSKIPLHDDSRIQTYHTNFKFGVLTIDNNFVLRTPPGINLMTIQPPNYFIPNLMAMSGVVESDNLRRTFTFNLRVTKPHTRIQIKKGDWLAAFIPVKRYFVDKFDLMNGEEYFSRDCLDNEKSDREKLAFERYNSVDIGGDIGKPNDSGRRYFKGIHATDEAYPDHQKRL
ncbi:MAG: hypothetical protein EBW76_06990 [Actinobacteria bacterium]|jgi:hypothetical protein|nr:hypothetical protein [Actinomycetota bacterium]NCW93011.1 hypothetical protein [Actinomycetota bacterium]